ncbi:MAG: hypothetical protein JNL67_13285 [Planctomycetaceae bacterium]|nr:hypothetical protein [Planctomycetaceae bacterium]
MLGLHSLIRIEILFLLLAWAGSLCAQETLSLPQDQVTRDAVERAGEWLVRHVQTGSLVVDGREQAVSVIAWKDPTLSPEIPDCLAGYTITDTLWASYALSLTHPNVAQKLRESLERLGCNSNSLHEVVWQPLASIHHKPTGPDIVHGRSLGIMTLKDHSVGDPKSHMVTVDVRNFIMTEDPAFTAGHPMLFAEHAVYQSLFEFRKGQVDSALGRLRRIFRPESSNDPNHIRWDTKHGVLTDFAGKSEYDNFLSGQTNFCRQYSFKLAVLLYGCRFMGLEQEFPSEMERIHQRLQDAQLESGGLPHFFDIAGETNSTIRRSDATGEATAIFMLAETWTAKQ